MKEEKTLTTESGATRCGQSELADGQSCGRLVLSPVRAESSGPGNLHLVNGQEVKSHEQRCME